jgi:hypothetical protein
LFERRQPGVLVKTVSAKRSVLPLPHFQLPSVHRLLHIDASFGEPPEMFFPQFGVNEMERFIQPVEAIFDGMSEALCAAHRCY